MKSSSDIQWDWNRSECEDFVWLLESNFVSVLKVHGQHKPVVITMGRIYSMVDCGGMYKITYFADYLFNNGLVRCDRKETVTMPGVNVLRTNVISVDVAKDFDSNNMFHRYLDLKSRYPGNFW